MHCSRIFPFASSGKPIESARKIANKITPTRDVLILFCWDEVLIKSKTLLIFILKAGRSNRTAPVQFDVQNLRRPGGERRKHCLSPPGNRAGDFRAVQKCFGNVAAEGAVRHRAGRQGVSQRGHAAQFHLPLARVRADGTGIFHQARRGGGSDFTVQCDRVRNSDPNPNPASRNRIGAGRRGINTGSRNASRSTKASACRATTLEEYWQKPEELAHYARACVDILFKFPLGRECMARRNWKASPRAAILT